MVGLIYKGKKRRFSFDNPATGKIDFVRDIPVQVSQGAANWLMKFSPNIFEIAKDVPGPVFVAEEKKEEPKVVKKYVSQMNITELIEEGSRYGLDLSDDDMSRTEMIDVIRGKQQEDK